MTGGASEGHPGPVSNVLMCRQWWKVCWVYGDQSKYYRQLYGRRTTLRTLGAHPSGPPGPLNPLNLRSMQNTFCALPEYLILSP
jgi:hypothetical protein